MRNLLLLLIIFQLGCQNETKKIGQNTQSEAISKILNNHLQPTGNQPVHSILFQLKNPDFNYHQAFGMADGKQQKVEKEFQFRIASITKIFTATLVLQLAEDGKFQLEDPIYDYVKDYDFIQIDSIHKKGTVSFAKEITIQQLLQHRSGLPDFYDDMPAFIGYMEKHKKSNWTAADLFTFYYESHLNTQTHFEPGKGFHYSDVNFLLLAKLIEKVTRTSMSTQYRQRIFQPLDMKDTYYEYYEEPIGIKKMAHAFYQTEDIDKSGRWSGSGLISTTKDLTIFIEGLMNGQLFKEKSTLKSMMEMASKSKKYQYGMGLMELTILDEKYYGHSGFWGNHLLHCPAKQQTLCLSINQAAPAFDRVELIKAILTTKK